MSLLLAALVGATTLGVAASAVAAELPDVVINEVETDDPADGPDWIELKNRTDAEIDIAGWWVEDSGEEPVQLEGEYLVPAGGYLVLETDVDFGFGLGKDEVVAILLPDGETVVDSAEFPGDHAATTWGRCADGEGAFVVTAEPTRGEANACPSAADVLVINEIEASGGTPGDWIELANTGGAAVDAGGLQLLDGDAEHAKYVIPAGTIVEPGGYLVVEEEQFDWGLGADGDTVTLFDTDGETVVDSHGWTVGTATTLGRCPDGEGPFASTASVTKGAANDCAVVETPEIVISELDSNEPDWVELANLGDEDVDVAGWRVRDSNNALEELEGELVVPAGGYLVLEGEGADFDFGLGAADEFHLVYSDGFTEVDAVSWDEGHPTGSYSRCPDLAGELVMTFFATPGAANDCSAPPLDAADWFRINEIVTDDGDPDDWVELVNLSDEELDAGGLRLADSGDEPYTIPAGTLVEAGGFLVLERDADFGFGLSGDDELTLVAPDGETVVDRYEWDAHPDESYGRCPDGTGPFAQTEGVTKGAANQCPPFVAPTVVINEIESSGGTPGDWVEFYNHGEEPAELTGFRFRDNDEDHDPFVFPNGFVLEPGEFFVIHGDTPSEFPHGLGNDDSAILFAPDGVTVVDEYSWGPHAATTYGRCPDGTGAFTTTTTPTKGEPNDCAPAIVINEVESDAPADGTDWIELGNAGGGSVDLEGWTVKDSDDSHEHTLPATTIEAGGHLVLEEADFGFGLGGGDSVRLYDPEGELVDEHAWASHAPTSYGRCPDLTGEFAVTSEATPGSANACPGEIAVSPWPGGQTVTEVDVEGFFGGDMSGLAYEASATGGPGTLWAVNNDSGALFKLRWDGEAWVPVTGDGWAEGKIVRYPGGGPADAEGVGLVGGSSANGVYIAAERDDDASSVSRPSILRVDVTGGGTELAATEWNLAGDLALDIPALGQNAGPEGIAWIPDSYLTANGLVDDSTGEAYDPDDYPGHGGGLFFVAIEQDGGVYGYALAAGGYDRVVRFDSGFPGAMELEFDPERQALWVLCDEVCQGRSALFTIDGDGRFAAEAVYERPAEAPNHANEGFAIAAQSECVDGLKPVFWADDAAAGGHALRAGTISCVEAGGPGEPGEPDDDPVPPAGEELVPGNAGEVEAPDEATAGQTVTVFVGLGYAGQEVDAWILSTPTYLGRHTVDANGAIRVTIPASLAAGGHRIAVLGLDGEIIGWDSIEIAAAGPAELGETGGESGGAEWGALALLLAGALLVLAARRRRGAPAV